MITTDQAIQAALEASLEVLSEEGIGNAALFSNSEDQKPSRIAHMIKRQLLSEIDREIWEEVVAISPAEWLFRCIIHGRSVIRQEIGRTYAFSLRPHS